jgi:hypothetical protein
VRLGELVEDGRVQRLRDRAGRAAGEAARQPRGRVAEDAAFALEEREQRPQRGDEVVAVSGPGLAQDGGDVVAGDFPQGAVSSRPVARRLGGVGDVVPPSEFGLGLAAATAVVQGLRPRGDLGPDRWRQTSGALAQPGVVAVGAVVVEQVQGPQDLQSAGDVAALAAQPFDISGTEGNPRRAARDERLQGLRHLVAQVRRPAAGLGQPLGRCRQVGQPRQPGLVGSRYATGAGAAPV